MHSTKKPKTFDFDLLIIGSGAGGGVTAHLAAGYGKKVGLIEADKLGGDCPNYSCIPTKSLLTAANSIDAMKSASRHGLRASNISYSAESLTRWRDTVVTQANGSQNASAFTTDGIKVIHGHGHFLSPWVISVGSHRYSARTFLIATGSSPIIPNINGLEETGFITYREAGALKTFPKSIVIIGGGATAYEYSQIFSAFGARVHIIERHTHLLHGEDTEVGDITESNLQANGVRVHVNAKVTQVSGNAKHKVVVFEQNGQEQRIACETIMVASGKKPNVDLGLENTGIKFNEGGVLVNSNMQTSKKHIYAAGDVVGSDLFAHLAAQHARVAAHNMFHTKKVHLKAPAVPRIYYGMPEIACVGKTEHMLRMMNLSYQTAIAPIGIVGRSGPASYNSGFVKLIATHSGILIGASIVAPHAGEMLQELTFAIGHRVRACDVAETIHPFPTWSEAIRIAATRIHCD
jgi:dihydrolipoamide dehydrogenase